ncbi:WD repeat-containing protein-like protein [Tricladium varicosporioides]|nr:WD repeat-containing protein-like protein [Hymenoscyphus varicosporioides]
MASALKRKRGAVEVSETPKRAKSIKTSTNDPLQKLSSINAGWEAAFNPPTKTKELAKTNGTNAHKSESKIRSPSSEALDFEDMSEQDQWTQQQAYIRSNLQTPKSKIWALSESIGGRMINVDPVFSMDEKYFIVASRTALHVYATTNSLLVRSIKPKINGDKLDTRIITYCLSPTQSNIIWVACSDGAIYSIDWTSGAGADQWWGISSTGCVHMTVASMESVGRRRDVVFTTEMRKDGRWRVTANELAQPDSTIQTVARTIYTSQNQISFLKTAKEGTVIVGSAGNKIVLGRLKSTEYDTVDRIKYEFRVFESTDSISSVDIKVSERPGINDVKKSMKRTPVVDLVVGDVRGAIFVHNDLLANLIRSQDGSLPPGISLAPRKLHWHRQAVHTVKWSLDGNYIISGGTETVLVLWQLDTGKQQFLPHMSATIQNVVVSPSGSSYGVQLADNSAMILSTAELTPMTNIAGIQANVLSSGETIESTVLRLRDESWKPPLIQRIPAAINPASPSQLLLAVGQTQEINPYDPLVLSSPFLQTYDLGSGHNISRQALTRSNVTNVNATPSTHRLSEPRVTQMVLSHDGNWLATVDEWVPPERDIVFLSHQKKDLEAHRQSRREVFLKFWQWSHENNTWELVSRINKPHTQEQNSSYAGRILDLAADPESPRFSTIGEDGVVSIWSTKARKRDGVVVRGKDGKAFRNWYCQHAISLGKSELLVESENVSATAVTGCVAFSEDGSVLAAACSIHGGLLQLLDPDSGFVRQSHAGLFEGHIAKMAFIGQDLIMLSDQLLVFDLVSNETRLKTSLSSNIQRLSDVQKREMMHLSVDHQSRTFALALPVRNSEETYEKPLICRESELFIFHQDEAEPQLHEISSAITALLPAADSEGFVVLDTAAEVRVVHKKGSQIITTLAQSTEALHLEHEATESVGELLRLVEDENNEEMDDHEPPTPDLTVDGDDEDDENDTPVVSQQALTEIFDIGPSFALPPLEEMFYQVAGLFSSKPLAQKMS